MEVVTAAALAVSSAKVRRTTRSLRRPAVHRPAATRRRGIRLYRFDYATAGHDQSDAPMALHAYPRTGTYSARVTIVDERRASTTSAPVTVHVTDGIAPVAAIDSPRSGATVRLRRKQRLAFAGTARDPSRIRRVELALRLARVRAGGAAHERRRLPLYDGRRHLLLRFCSRPVFFRAAVRGERWSFRAPGGIHFPRGDYELRVARRIGRATARASTPCACARSFAYRLRYAGR